MRHRGKIGIQQYQIGGVFGGVAAGGHGDAAVRRFQGQYVVDPIAGHGDGVRIVLQGADHLLLLARGNPPKHIAGAHGLLQLFLCVQGGGIHIFFRMAQPGLGGNGRYGDRVIPRNHFQINALVVKILQDFRGLFSDNIGDQNQPQQLDVRGQAVLLHHLRGVGNHQHPHPLFGVFANLFGNSGVGFREQELIGAHIVGALVLKGGAAVFTVGREGNHMGAGDCLFWGKGLLQGAAGIVFLR